MLVEAGWQFGFRAVDLAQGFSGFVIHNLVVAVLQASQFYLPGPMGGVEGVVHFFSFLDGVGFGQVEAYVVEVASVFSAGEHFFFVDGYPLRHGFFALGSEVGVGVLGHFGGEDELGAYYSAYAYGGGEIVVAVAFFHVVAEVGDVVSHEGFQGFAFGTNLERTFGVRGYGHVEVRHGKERIGGAAGAEFYQRVGLYAAGGFVDFAEEIGEGLYGVFRALVMMGWVET